MRKTTLLILLIGLPTAVFADDARTAKFEGFGISVDYNINQIDDISYPGGQSHANSGIPSITLDYWKGISDTFLGGAYVIQDLATTDTVGKDPDAKYPIEGGFKLGYAVTEDFLGYVRGGYSWSRLSGDGYSHWMNGPSYGLGVEYMITNDFFTRLELSQQNYERINWIDGSADKIYINSYGISFGWRF